MVSAAPPRTARAADPFGRLAEEETLRRPARGYPRLLQEAQEGEGQADQQEQEEAASEQEAGLLPCSKPHQKGNNSLKFLYIGS